MGVRVCVCVLGCVFVVVVWECWCACAHRPACDASTVECVDMFNM